MKKANIVLALLTIVGFAQGAYSATLNWGSSPVGTIITLDKGIVISASFGFGHSLVVDIFSHSYGFKASDTNPVFLRMIELPHEKIDIKQVIYDGMPISFNKANQRWFGDGENILNHVIQLFGSVDRASNAYLLTTETISNAPSPASIWLFGPAFLGLLGISMRKRGTKTHAM
jgi:hypothetical protein